MKTKRGIKSGLILLTILLQSCTVFKGATTPLYAVDPVCGRQVNVAESYTWKYQGTEYYFDTYNCRETFKINPERFLNANKCLTETRVSKTK